jgi:hypothetical protein
LLDLIFKTVASKIGNIAAYGRSLSASAGTAESNQGGTSDIALLDATKLLSNLFPQGPGTSEQGTAATAAADNSSKTDSSYFANCSLKELKQLTRTLFWGLKTIVVGLVGLKLNRSRHPSLLETQAFLFDSIDASVFGKSSGKYKIAEVINNGLYVCSLLLGQSPASANQQTVPDAATDDITQPSTHVSSNHVEVQEILEYINSVFCVLSAIHMREVFDSVLPVLYAKCKENAVFLYLLQQLINNTQISHSLLDILVCFLLSKLHDLNYTGQHTDANVMLKAFKILLSSLVKVPENERILRSKLVALIMGCFRLAYEEPSPKNYYFLLRMIFRAITGGKFEQSYKLCAPYVPMLLQGFTRLIQQSKNQSMQSVLLELTLTLPARFSTLVPHIPVLLSHIGMALRSKGEVANIGLRTLELWIDHLNPEVVTNMLQQNTAVAHAVISGVCDHLRLHPHPYGSTSIKLLGKLGCHNERFLRGYTLKPKPDSGVCNSLLNQFSFRYREDEASGSQLANMESSTVDVSDTIRAACEMLLLLKSTVYPCSLNDTLEDKLVASSAADKVPASLSDDLLNYRWTPDSKEPTKEHFLVFREKQEKVVLSKLLSVPMIENNTNNIVGLDTTALSEEISYLVKFNTQTQLTAALSTVLAALSSMLCAGQNGLQGFGLLQEYVKSNSGVPEVDCESRKFRVYCDLIHAVVTATIENTLRQQATDYLKEFFRLCCKSVIETATASATRQVASVAEEHVIVALVKVICTMQADFRPKVQQASAWCLTELFELLDRLDTDSKDQMEQNSDEVGVVEELKTFLAGKVLAFAFSDDSFIGGIRLSKAMFSSNFLSPVAAEVASTTIIDSLLTAYQKCECAGDGNGCPNGLQTNVVESIDIVVAKYFTPESGAETASAVSQLEQTQQAVLSQFVNNIFHVVHTRRTVSEQYIGKISKIVNMSVSDLIAHFKSDIEAVLTKSSDGFDTMPFYSFGIMSGMAFVMNLSDPIFELDERSFQMLTQCYIAASGEPLVSDNVTYEMDGCLAEISPSQSVVDRNVFPLKPTDAMEKRIVFVRMLSALMKFRSMADVVEQFQQDMDARLSVICKSVILAFNLLLVPSFQKLHREALSAVKQVLISCKRQLDAIDANKPEHKPIQVLCGQVKSCVREYCVHANNISACSKPYLYGIALVLEHLASYENMTLCNILHDHLKKGVDVEGITTKNIWPPGQELNVVEALLGLCQYVPLQLNPAHQSSNEISFDEPIAGEETILKSFVEALNSYIQLEAVKFRYRQVTSTTVKLEEPIMRFVLRYKSECAKYLLRPQNIARAEVRLLSHLWVHLGLHLCLYRDFVQICSLLVAFFSSSCSSTPEIVDLFSKPACLDYVGRCIGPIVDLMEKVLCSLRKQNARCLWFHFFSGGTFRQRENIESTGFKWFVILRIVVCEGSYKRGCFNRFG